MDETVRQANIELQAENQKLQSLNTSLHKKYHTMSLKVIILIYYNYTFVCLKVVFISLLSSYKDLTQYFILVGWLTR